MASLLGIRFNTIHVSFEGFKYLMANFRLQNVSSICFLLLLIFGIQTSQAKFSLSQPESGFFPSSQAGASSFSFTEGSPLLVDPNFTIRLANPQFTCSNQQYCLDVELQSDIANKELYAMNFRIWYDENVLELINFTGYVGGYGAIQPNPPGISTYGSLGPAWFGFGGAAEWVNGAIQKTNGNAAPIYISTTGWTKIFKVCFHIDDPNPNMTSFCPSVVLDLKSDPTLGGFLGSSGVVMTVVNGSGSLPTSEHAVQYNWQYTGNGSTTPYGLPYPVSCVSLGCGNQSIIVTNINDLGTGSLRDAIAIANPGDTVTFSTSLAGLTINLTSGRILFNKNIYIRSNVTPRIKITSTSLPGLFDILANNSVEFKDLDITSGLSTTNNDGAAFNNLGSLKLISVKVFKNPNLPVGQYLIRNKPGSTFSTYGASYIQFP